MPRWDADASKRAVTANSKIMSVDESTHEVTHLLAGEMQVFVQAKAGGTILPTSPAPQPAQTAEYTFAADGFCAWLDVFPVNRNVSAGDTVQVIYDVNSGLYSYELVPDTNRVGSAVTNDSTVAGASVSDALNTLGGAIDNEAVARAAADTVLQGAIDAEEAARLADVAALEGADAALQANITGAYNDLTQADTFLQNAITAETQARQAAVSGEASARAAADTTLQTNINNLSTNLDMTEADIRADFAAADSAEALARSSEDIRLGQRIDAEAQNSSIGRAYLQSNIDNVNSDVQTRMKKDGSNSSVASLVFNTALPLEDCAVGAMRWNSERGELEYRVSIDSYIGLGSELQFKVKNADVVKLTAGMVVYIYSGSGDNILVKRADPSDPLATERTYGMITQPEIGLNGSGQCAFIGLVHDVPTSAYANGAELFLGANGTYTNIKPTAPTPAISLGYVWRSHGTVGAILFVVRRPNTLRGASDVHMPVVVDGNVPVWDNATSRFVAFNLSGYISNTATQLDGKQTIANLSNDIIKDAESTTMYPSVKEMKDYVDTNINQDEWYGIEHDVTHGDSAWTRIGKMDYHRTLPIQNNRKGVLLGDGGTENFQLNPNDFNLTDTGAAADLSGVSGQMMVNQGRFYARYEMEGNIERVKISPYALAGFIEIPSYYTSSEEASLNRTTLKLSSCVNNSIEYRGGNNTEAYDAGSNTLLGRPVTNLSLALFRTYARNRGAKWNANVYSTAVAEYILRLVEYANTNSQLPFTEELTPEGYKQGGLGAGVTTLDSTKWGDWNGRNPFIPCGYCASLGIKSGVVNYQMPVEYDVTQPIVEVNSYRGVVLPFGHTSKYTDGVKALIQADDAGGQSLLYTTNDPSKFSSAGIEGYKLTGTLPRESGYIKQMMFGLNLDILPQSVGGSATTYFCDYFYTSIPETGVSERAIAFGGSAHNGSTAGCGCSYSNLSPSHANVAFGSRLCYIP